MKVQTLLAIGAVAAAFCVGVILVSLMTDERSESSASQEESLTVGGSAPADRSNVRAGDGSGAAGRGSSPAGTDPDDAVPTRDEMRAEIAAAMAKARGTFFNFSCACCGDHLRYAAILRENGLTWPRVWEGLDDAPAFQNLKYREEQAILRIPKDARNAVAFFEQAIAFEREKYETRLLREPWEATRTALMPAGDPSAFASMIQEVPDRHFEGLVFENMSDLAGSPAHLNAIYSAASARPQSGKLRVYAAFADMELLKGTPQAGRMLSELQNFTGRNSPATDSWASEIEEHFATFARNSQPGQEEAPDL